MESLGDILRRITERDTLRHYADGAVSFPEAPDRVDVCTDCNGAGWVGRAVPVGHPDFGQAFPCLCQAESEPAARLAALRRYSNLGALGRITFAGTRIEGPLPDAGSQDQFQQAMAAAVGFAEDPRGWLVFTGPSGSGKTHLAVAVTNRCIELGFTAFFIVAADLLDHLRATYAPDNPVTYDELFDQVRNVPLLVVDDLNTVTATTWAQEKLFQIVNHRFNAQLPTVITVRGPLERLDEALRTRIESSDGFSRVMQLGQYNTRLARRIGDLPADMLRRMTFAGFDQRGATGATSEQQRFLADAYRKAVVFASYPNGWILFSGPPGTGKTHLSVAIAGELIHKGEAVFFAFVPDLLDHLRTSFSPNSPVTYDELFEQIKTVPVLILDDLGAESSTSWAEEKLYQIVVYRYEKTLPTIITTTYGVEELDKSKPRLASRIMDSMVVDVIGVDAPDYRGHRRVDPPVGR